MTTPPILTPAQTTLTYAKDMGWSETAPVETELRDIDVDASPEEKERTPALAAKIVTMGWKASSRVKADGKWEVGPIVDGRFTQVWVSHGDTMGELSPAEAREVAQTMRDFADQLDALCEVADRIAEDDFKAAARLDEVRA